MSSKQTFLALWHKRMRRPESRGFILENLGEDMEDSFSGDGLEKERQWLADFRERRGRSRSGHRGENAKESRDSSRYSFSSEYSSGQSDSFLIEFKLSFYGTFMRFFLSKHKNGRRPRLSLEKFCKLVELEMFYIFVFGHKTIR